MTTFPELVPSARTWSPGDYPHSAWTPLNGKQNRVLNSNVVLSSQLRVQFNAITEAQMVEIITHYQQQYGSFYSFTLPSEIWNGLTNANDMQLSGYTWRYLDPPVVTDIGCGRHNVELTLETTPQAGVFANGIESVVFTSVQAGAVTASAGIDATVAVTISGGATEIIPSDEYFADVALLLHMDGSNDSTTFTDDSNNNLSLTVNGSAKISTSVKKFGTGSLNCNSGTDAWLTYPAASGDELDIAANEDYTVEFWIHPTAVTSVSTLSSTTCIFEFSGSADHAINLITSGGAPKIAFTIDYSSGGSITHQTAVELDEWQHVALVRASDVVSLYLGGVKSSTSSTDGTALNNAAFVSIGPRNNGADTRLYIDDLRITIGVARYTATFTPPTGPFSDA